MKTVDGVRDEFGILIQHDANDPDNKEKWDGGDSAFTTGIMAFSCNREDAKLMPKFIINNRLVRHPYEDRWRKPNLESRDQVIAFFAGMDSARHYGYFYKDIHPKDYWALEDACLGYAKRWFVNKDILLPAQKFYLYRLALARPPFWLKPLAYAQQFLSIYWDAYIYPNHEMNQSILMNCIYGKWWINKLYKLHPNLEENVTEYFSGWRDKAGVGEKFIKFMRICRDT